MHLIQKLKPSHIRLIVKIAEVQKLQIAADALAMSQPAASRILKEIEAEVGGPLFLRHARGMDVTEVGEAFLRHARVILSQLESLQTEVDQLNAGARGKVSVGSVTGPAVSCLVPAVEALKRAAPDVRVSIEIGPSSRLVRGIEEEQFDFVLGRLPTGYASSELELLPGRKEDVDLLVQKDHPLADRKIVLLDEARHYEWVIQDRGSPIRTAVEAAFHDLGLPPPDNVTDSSSLLVSMALLRNGAVISPQTREVAGVLMDENFGSRIKALRIPTNIHVPTFYVIKNRHREMNRAGQLMLDEVLRRL